MWELPCVPLPVRLLYFDKLTWLVLLTWSCLYSSCIILRADQSWVGSFILWGTALESECCADFHIAKPAWMLMHRVAPFFQLSSQSDTHPTAWWMGTLLHLQLCVCVALFVLWIVYQGEGTAVWIETCSSVVTFGMYTAESSGLELLWHCSPVLCKADMPAVCPWALKQLSSLCDGGDIGVHVLRCGWHQCGLLAALLTALQRAIRSPWTEQIVSFCPDTHTPTPHGPWCLTPCQGLYYFLKCTQTTHRHTHSHTGA